MTPVAHHELPHAGDYRLLDVVGEGILLVRNREGVLRAFYNVCRHRGARLCQESEAMLPESTEISCHFLFAPQEIARPDFEPADAVEFWDLVNAQDWTVCESVQSGIRARVHAQGYFSPMEDWNLDIRRYVSERLAGALPTTDLTRHP